MPKYGKIFTMSLKGRKNDHETPCLTRKVSECGKICYLSFDMLIIGICGIFMDLQLLLLPYVPNVVSTLKNTCILGGK